MHDHKISILRPACYTCRPFHGIVVPCWQDLLPRFFHKSKDNIQRFSRLLHLLSATVAMKLRDGKLE
ncbi:hypothetical protein Plhal304r1_c021g0075831 [Plasmopara halstedii]